MQRRRVSKQGIIAVEDSFELTESFSSDSKCILCHCGEDQGKLLHAALHASSCDILDSSSDEDIKEKDNDHTLVMDPQRIWMSRHPLKVTSNRHDFVHFYCALYSPVSWLHNGKKWCNVAQEVRRSFHFTCARCGLKGATLGCMNRKCNYSVHLPCAMEQGWNPSLVNKCSYQCPAHRDEDKDRKIELNQLELNDLSLGREAVEVTTERSLFLDAMMLPYTYTAVNLDSDDTQSHVLDIKKLRHCKCSGMACPRYCEADAGVICKCCTGRKYNQYIQNGPFRCLNPELMNDRVKTGENLSKPLEEIYECGLRCRCSFRCMNRVVGNGLQFQLQVTTLSNALRDEKLLKAARPEASNERMFKKGSVAANKREEWAVIVLEDVPSGAFICEWTGQYVLGDSKPFIPATISLSKSMIGRQDHNRKKLRTVVDILEAGDSACRGCDGLGSIVPVELWESAYAIEDVVEWSQSVIHGGDGIGDSILNNSRKRKRDLDDQSDDNTAVDPAVQEHMRNLIYIDSRYYSNVSRFITLTKNRAESNLSRRCVFVNDDGSKLHPRLALFADKFIPAGTALVLF